MYLSHTGRALSIYIIPVTSCIDLYGNQLSGDGYQERIGDNSELRDDSEEVEPGTNVLGTLGNRTTKDGGELVSIESDLHPVVEESKERSEREGHNKDGGESILNDCVDRG